MHYLSDTYVLIDLGYMKYPSEYFWLDGRVISALVCYIAGILKIPVETYIVGMDYIGVIFLSLAVFILFKCFKKILSPKSFFYELLILISTYLLIFSQYSLEYLLFPESAVMSLGVLFTVLAIKVMIDKPKYYYLKIFACLLITTLSYQGELNIFPVLAILVYLLKQTKEKQKLKVFFKSFFCDMIKLAIIVIINFIITLIAIKIGKNVFNSDMNRMIKIVNYRGFLLRCEIILRNIHELWNNCMYMLPQHTLTVTIIITLTLLTFSKSNIQTMINYSIFIVIIICICVIPMFVFDTGICGRVNTPLTMIMGISALILIADFEKIDSTFFKYSISVFVITLFIINSAFTIRNLSEHVIANMKDEQEGMQIKKILQKYENENNINVNKFAYVYDPKPQQFAPGILPMESMTERKLACPWSVLYAMNFFCNKDFELVDFPFELLDDEINYFNDSELLKFNRRFKNYTEFSEEQIFFIGDTIYMIIY